MKPLLYFLLMILGFGSGSADTQAPEPVGIIILKAVAGYEAAAVPFVSIQWVDTNGGYVIDNAGNKTAFINDAIGRVIYFDQAYYEEVDHNQNWTNWRAGLQNREVVFPPIDSIGLTPQDLPRLRREELVLEDIVQRYPSGNAQVAPIIALIKDDTAKLSSGQILQNGKWILAKEAVAPAGAPVVGQVNPPVTFTTKDGTKYVNVIVTPTDTGLSVITSDGGASVPFDQLPDDITSFPAGAREKIQAWKTAHQPAPVAKAPAPPPPTGFLAAPETFMNKTVHNIWAYFSPDASPAPSKRATSNSAPSPPAPSNPATSSSAPAESSGQMDANAVVLIKGDYAQGTGFLTKTLDGPVVITNLHVIAANPNLRILTASGEQITPLSLKGASDRDLAMFAIQDNHYTYLELAANVDQSAGVGDATIIPGDSEGGEVTLKTDGKLIGIGPQRVEFDNPIYHGNSGGPVFDVKTGKVVAVVVGATEMKPSNDVDKDSFANANSAIKGPMRYFGLRVDTVPAWQDYDQNMFSSETLFLKNFHDESRALDSYLNGAGYEKKSWAQEEGPPDSKYYLGNAKVRTAVENYQSTLEHHDQKTALQELAWSLGTLADDGLVSLQNPRNFYPYDQERVKYELEYRQALKNEIQKVQATVNDSGLTSGHDFGL